MNQPSYFFKDQRKNKVTAVFTDWLENSFSFENSKKIYCFIKF